MYYDPYRFRYNICGNYIWPEHKPEIKFSDYLELSNTKKSPLNISTQTKEYVKNGVYVGTIL